jgi:hypothetical protein
MDINFRFRCRVKSLVQPHIKWLRKLGTANTPSSASASAAAEPFTSNRAADDSNVLSVYTMNMGNEKYRVLNSSPDVPLGEGEYLNRLVIPNAAIEDSGLYICFVTNSGFGALTYKSAFLKVLKRRRKEEEEKNVISSSNGGAVLSDNLILISVVSLVVAVFIVGVVVVACVLRRSQRTGKGSKKSSTGSSSSNTSSDVDGTERPFLMSAGAAAGHSTLSLPPPPMDSSEAASCHFITPSSGSAMGQWSRTVYPAAFGSHVRYSFFQIKTR